MAGGGSGIFGGGGSGGGSSVILSNPGVSVQKYRNKDVATDELYILERDLANFCDDLEFIQTSRIRLYATEDGLYDCGGTVSWSPEDSDIRLAYMMKNSLTRISTDIIGTYDAFNNSTEITTALVYLLAGEFIEFLMVETSGFPLTLVVQADLTSPTSQGGWGRFWIQRIDQGAPNIGCRVRRTTNQLILNSVFTPVDFESAPRDTGGFWSALDPQTISITENGRYNVGFNTDWDPNDVSVRYAILMLNGVYPIFTDINQRGAGEGKACTSSDDGYVDLFKGDTLKLLVFQFTGGGNLNLKATDSYAPEVWVEMIRNGTLAAALTPKPGASVVRTSDQPVDDDGLEHLVLFQAAVRDTGSFWSAGTPGEFAISSDGEYKLGFSVFFGGSNLGVGPGEKSAWLKRAPAGGGPEEILLQDVRGFSPDPTTLHAQRPFTLLAGDKLRLYVRQETGATINIINTDVGGLYQPISPLMYIQQLCET